MAIILIDSVLVTQLDALVQDCSISSALAMKILQSCTKPSVLNQWFDIKTFFSALMLLNYCLFIILISLSEIRLRIVFIKNIMFDNNKKIIFRDPSISSLHCLIGHKPLIALSDMTCYGVSWNMYFDNGIKLMLISSGWLKNVDII